MVFDGNQGDTQFILMKKGIFTAKAEFPALIPVTQTTLTAPRPVGRQLVGDESAWDLSDDVAPKEGPVDQPHSLWVPVKLSFLKWS